MPSISLNPSLHSAWSGRNSRSRQGRSWIWAITLAIVVTSGCAGPAPPATRFADEFNGSRVDPALWTVADGPGDSSNGEVQCYRPANTIEDGGSLRQTAMVDASCSGYSYTSGAVQMASYSFTYGTVEVRAQLAGGSGPWPAIWLLGADCQRPTWLTAGPRCRWPRPGSEEIDIAEVLSSDQAAVNQQIHSSAGVWGCLPSLPGVASTWHTYALVWRPNSLTFKIDGAVTCTLTKAVPSRPMFLILDTALGGTGGGPVSESTLPQSSVTDYVRVS